jgi:hypothetical protein
LIATANRTPINAAATGAKVSGADIQQATDSDYLLFPRSNTFSPITWESLGPAVQGALNGDASAFTNANPPPPDNPAYGEEAISCLDFPVQAADVTEFANRIRIAKIISPHLGGATQTGRIISQCSGWPRPARNPRHTLRVKGAPGALIINATHDPSTAYTWALSLQAELPGSVLLTRRGDGHTSYFDSSCARRAADDYLISRKLPARGSVCRS